MPEKIAFHGVQGAEDYDGFPTGYSYLLAEPKFDGFRLACVVKNGKVTMYCREPKPVMWAANLGHIEEEILELGFDNCMVDGEVMHESWNKTGIIKSGCAAKGYKRPSDEVLADIRANVKYHVFDWVDLDAVQFVENRQKKLVPIFALPLVQRQDMLEKYLRGAELTNILQRVIARAVRNEQELMAFYDELLELGYEGAILKFPASVYNFIKNKSWRKLKPHETIELRIVNVVEGQGKYAGSLGAFECVNAAGVAISVGTFSGVDDAERARIFREREQMPGKIIEVEVAKSDVAKARHPSFKRWRDDRTSL